MARKRPLPERSGRTVLLVDDSEEYLHSTRRIIERDGHLVMTASSGHEGLAALGETPVDLVLVDYLMPGMTGEEFVFAMRAAGMRNQVILQTGYANEHPPRDLLRRLDIQGFHDKSDGPEKLALWVDVGLKAAYTQALMDKSRQGLRYVLDATPALHRMRPLAELLQGVLLQTAGLLGSTHSFVASIGAGPRAEDGREGFVALGHPEGELCLHAVTGRFREGAGVHEALGASGREAIAQALTGAGVTTSGRDTIAPLRVGERTIGVIYVDEPVDEEWQRELLAVFANQAAVAIYNASLYEMAALDALTGVSTRRFFDQALARELRAATRAPSPLGLLVVDVNAMKGLNDTMGHAAGDRALTAVGSALRRAVRSTDIVGRIGGDEFAVLLPATDAAGVQNVLARIRRDVGRLQASHDGLSFEVNASVGAAVLMARVIDRAALSDAAPQLMQETAIRLFEAADADMYLAKRANPGGGVTHVDWSLSASATAT